MSWWAVIRPSFNRSVAKILDGKAKQGSVPPLWDGHAGERIAEIVVGRHASGEVRAT